MLSKKPIIVVNCKSYERGMGEHALTLLHLLERYHECARFIMLPNVLDLSMISKVAQIEIYAQGADVASYGPYTGAVPMASLVEMGVSGVMIGHKEALDSENVMMQKMLHARSQGLHILAMVSSLKTLERAKLAGAEFMVYEPEKVMGGALFVTKGHDKDIAHMVEREPDRLLLGSGISTYKEVTKSLDMGAQGVIVASSIIEADDQERALKALLGLI